MDTRVKNEAESFHSIRLEEARFWSRVDKSGECWIYNPAHTTPKSYGHFSVNGKRFSAHRVSWMLEHDGLIGDLNICHKCDTRACVRPSHLFVGTQSDNMRDCVSKKRHSSHNSPSKFSVEQIRYIRETYKHGDARALAALADEMGAHFNTVRRIATRKALANIL